MKLYIANKKYSSWSMRPWVLMHALDISFEEILIPFDAHTRNRAFADISPTGKVPCLVDGNLAIWDSLAIVEYLAESRPSIWPEAPAARAWARSAAAEMHSGFAALCDECSMNCQLVIELGERSARLNRDLTRLESLWADGLKRFGGPWLAGDRFTAVDAFFAPVTVRVRGYQLALSSITMAYADRLRTHRSVEAWVSAGIEEKFDDIPHRMDCVRDRRIAEDLQNG